MAGLAFWFAPAQDAPCVPIIKAEMRRLRSEILSSSAEFQPHATILASLKEEGDWNRDWYWEKAQQLVQEWRESFGQTEGEGEGTQVDLKEVCTRGWYFQSILISLQPTKSILSLNDTFRKAFSAEHQPPYFPHISLLYSDLSEEQAQKKIDEMELNGIWQRKAQGEAAGCWFGSEANGRFDTVRFTEVQLWDSNGDVGEWKLLNRMPL